MFYRFARDIFINKQLLLNLVKNDFKSRYLNNYLGILWAFIQPSITMLIFWFVFQVGLKSAPTENVPFVLWLVAGMVPWFFITEALGSGTNAVLENSFLVKKIVFRVSLLPIVKIASALIVHIFFILFMLGMFVYYGFMPNLYWLEMFYYLFCSIVLMLGMTWFTSSVVVFFRDLGQIIGMTIQFGFWLTPIFWKLSKVPENYRWIFKMNPAYYIVQGFRDAIIYHLSFRDKMGDTLIFWTITGIIFLGGGIVFHKLRPHFADVL